MELLVAEGPDRGRRLAVDTSARSIGRNMENDLALTDGSVSGRHAIVRAIDGAHVEVTDMASTNGTWVGDERVSGAHTVAAGAVITIGNNRLEVRTTTNTATFADAQDVRRGSAHTSTPVASSPPLPPQAPSASNAGPVAGGNVSMAGEAVAGRDLNYHEGFRIRSWMRASARRLLRFGIALMALGMLAGVGAGAGMLVWSSQPGSDPFDGRGGFSEEYERAQFVVFAVLGLGAVVNVVGLVLVIVSLVMRREQVREVVPVSVRPRR